MLKILKEHTQSSRLNIFISSERLIYIYQVYINSKIYKYQLGEWRDGSVIKRTC